MEHNLLFPSEKQAQFNALCATIVEKVRIYFKDPQHRKKFEAWYREKYGKSYVWRTISREEITK